MSLVVVADTSPINYLLETGYVELLPRLYGQVILPTAVHSELSDRGSSDAVRQWASALPAWITVQKPTASPQLLSGLHRGEMDAIALAEELHAGLVLMDDAAGVRYALERGLTITGTLGVLLEAAQNGWVQIEAALSKLKGTDFRATPGLYESPATGFRQATHPAPAYSGVSLPCWPLSPEAAATANRAFVPSPAI